MRQSVVLLLSFGALAVFGQTPADSIAGKRLELASQELQRVQKLVEAGAESRVRLEQAEQDLADEDAQQDSEQDLTDDEDFAGDDSYDA